MSSTLQAIRGKWVTGMTLEDRWTQSRAGEDNRGSIPVEFTIGYRGFESLLLGSENRLEQVRVRG
jgi:hypothetical protein